MTEKPTPLEELLLETGLLYEAARVQEGLVALGLADLFTGPGLRLRIIRCRCLPGHRPCECDPIRREGGA